MLTCYFLIPKISAVLQTHFLVASGLLNRLRSRCHHDEPVYLREEAAGEFLLSERRGAQEVCGGAQGSHRRGQRDGADTHSE